MKHSFGRTTSPIAAVVVVASLLTTACTAGQGAASPIPASTTRASTPPPAATLTPMPSPISLPLNPQELTVTEPGTYLAGDPFQIPMTMTVPAGWVGKVGGPYAAYLDKAGSENGGAGIVLSLSQTIYANPCHDRGFLAPQPGPTVDAFAAALARLPGFVATTPTEAAIDGYSGKQLTLTAPASFAACTLSSDGYRLWQLPLGGIFAFTPGQRMTLRIVDVDGKRLVVSSATYPATNAQDLAEVQEILNSIRVKKNS